MQVKTGDTRDSEGKARFFPVKPNNLVFKNQFLAEKFWIFNYLSYPLNTVIFQFSAQRWEVHELFYFQNNFSGIKLLFEICYFISLYDSTRYVYNGVSLVSFKAI